MPCEHYNYEKWTIYVQKEGRGNTIPLKFNYSPSYDELVDSICDKFRVGRETIFGLKTDRYIVDEKTDIENLREEKVKFYLNVL